METNRRVRSKRDCASLCNSAAAFSQERRACSGLPCSLNRLDKMANGGTLKGIVFRMSESTSPSSSRLEAAPAHRTTTGCFNSPDAFSNAEKYVLLVITD